ANLPERQRKMLEELHKTDEMLAGKKVLVVDDDIRNIFAMTSLLERHNMQVVSAENGRDAINVLEGSDDIDVALMDIMMPEMDGYDTIHEIRKLQRFKTLPILAHRQSDEGRPREVHRGRRFRLHFEAGRYRTTPFAIESLVASLIDEPSAKI